MTTEVSTEVNNVETLQEQIMKCAYEGKAAMNVAMDSMLAAGALWSEGLSLIDKQSGGKRIKGESKNSSMNNLKNENDSHLSAGNIITREDFYKACGYSQPQITKTIQVYTRYNKNRSKIVNWRPAALLELLTLAEDDANKIIEDNPDGMTLRGARAAVAEAKGKPAPTKPAKQSDREKELMDQLATMNQRYAEAQHNFEATMDELEELRAEAEATPTSGAAFDKLKEELRQAKAEAAKAKAEAEKARKASTSGAPPFTIWGDMSYERALKAVKLIQQLTHPDKGKDPSNPSQERIDAHTIAAELIADLDMAKHHYDTTPAWQHSAR